MDRHPDRSSPAHTDGAIGADDAGAGTREQLLAAARAHHAAPGVLEALEALDTDRRRPLLASLWPMPARR